MGVGELWEALKVVYTSLRWLLRALKARRRIKALFRSSQPAASDELYLFQLKTFFFPHLPVSCYFSEGQRPRVSLCLFSWVLLLFLNSTPPCHPIFSLCLNPQDSADSRALARSHLHRRRVFQRGANRLWQRPKVSKTSTI